MRIRFLQNIVDIIRGKRKLFLKNYQESYSQAAEDLIIKSFIDSKHPSDYKGFFVDIGAFHPIILSNTYLFYKRGWRGINIDARPDSMKIFNKIRNRDINIECGISDKNEELDYYMFGSQACNTFDKEEAQDRINEGLDLIKTEKIKLRPINDILQEYLPENQHIDFMTIDIEGKELDILKSLDFEKYAPDFFLIEDLNYTLKDFCNYHETEMYSFLKDKGYKLLAKGQITMLFGK